MASRVPVGLSAPRVPAWLPAPARPLWRAWLALGAALSRVTAPIVMGVLYFAVLTPIALVARALGHRPLARRRDATTFWFRRDDEPPSSMQRPF